MQNVNAKHSAIHLYLSTQNSISEKKYLYSIHLDILGLSWNKVRYWLTVDTIIASKIQRMYWSVLKPLLWRLQQWFFSKNIWCIAYDAYDLLSQPCVQSNINSVAYCCKYCGIALAMFDWVVIQLHQMELVEIRDCTKCICRMLTSYNLVWI